MKWSAELDENAIKAYMLRSLELEGVHGFGGKVPDSDIASIQARPSCSQTPLSSEAGPTPAGAGAALPERFAADQVKRARDRRWPAPDGRPVASPL